MPKMYGYFKKISRHEGKLLIKNLLMSRPETLLNPTNTLDTLQTVNRLLSL